MHGKISKYSVRSSIFLFHPGTNEFLVIEEDILKISSKLLMPKLRYHISKF